MAANLMAQRWRERQVAITLIESPEIGIVGVGEGSTPLLGKFFETLGIADSDWMPKCNATYKNGIRFSGWRSEEHTSELQSLMRISYAVFCLKKKKTSHTNNDDTRYAERLLDRPPEHTQ